MAMEATATGTNWNFLERGRTAGEVQTGAAGKRVGGIGLNTTEAGLPPDTGAGIAAGTQTALCQMKSISEMISF